MKTFSGIALALALGLGMTASVAAQDETPKPDRKELIKKFDKNGDGKLDETERKAMVEALGERRRGGKPGADKPGTDKPGEGRRRGGEKPGEGKRPDRDELIKKFDKNGDGKLDEEERKAMRDAASKDRKPGEGRRGGDERRAELIEKFDKNGDGELDEAERKEARGSMGGRRGDERGKRGGRRGGKGGDAPKTESDTPVKPGKDA